MKHLKNNAIGKWSALAKVFILFTMISCNSSQGEKATESNVDAPLMTIHEAVFMGNLKETKAHIAAGSDLNKKDAYGSAPLTIVAIFDKPEIAKLLIEAGADVNVTSADGSTPLHSSSFFCRTEIVKALLEAGADVTIRNNFGATALESITVPFEDIKPAYDQVGRDLGPLGLRLDYKQIKETRPVIAEIIEAHNN